MATDIEKLVVQLSADVRSYQREMSKARGVNDRTFNAIRKKALDSSKTVEAAVTQAGRKIAGIFAAVGTARGAVALVDTATRITNALKVAGLSGDQLNAVYDRLFQSAQKNAAPIESLVQLYSRLSLVQKNLGASQEQLLKFSDAIGVALRVGGTDAQQASGALLQLSQALGAGVVRSEEFNSLMEGAPTILQAAANGIKEAGGSVQTLRQIMLAGNLSSAALFQGTIVGAKKLETQLVGSESTISARMIRFQNVLIDVAGKLDKSTTASKAFGTALDTAATDVQNINFDKLVAQIQSVIDVLTAVPNAAAGFADSVSAATGLDRIGEMVNGGAAYRSYFNGALNVTSRRAVQNRVNGAFEFPDQSGGDLTPDLIRQRFNGGVATTPKKPRLKEVKPDEEVSVKDPRYRVHTPPGSSGGKGSGSASAESRFADDIQSVKDRTTALVEEQKIIGLSYEAQEKRRMALDLEQAALADLRDEAQKKGQADLDAIKLSDSQREKIEATSAAYARQADALRKIEEQQQRNEELASEFYDTFKSGAIDAITGAQDLGDALTGLAQKFSDLFLNAAFDGLFGANGGGFTSLFGGGGSDPWSNLRVPGRAAGGPVSAGKPYIVGEKRPELFVPSQSGRIVPKVPSMAPLPKVQSVGARSLKMVVNVDGARGDQHIVDLVHEGVGKGIKEFAGSGEFKARTIVAVRDARSRNVKF